MGRRLRKLWAAQFMQVLAHRSEEFGHARQALFAGHICDPRFDPNDAEADAKMTTIDGGDRRRRRRPSAA